MKCIIFDKNTKVNEKIQICNVFVTNTVMPLLIFISPYVRIIIDNKVYPDYKCVIIWLLFTVMVVMGEYDGS